MGNVHADTDHGKNDYTHVAAQPLRVNLHFHCQFYLLLPRYIWLLSSKAAGIASYIHTRPRVDMYFPTYIYGYLRMYTYVLTYIYTKDAQ